MNKLTIEEQYLTLEQTKELQELGIDFNSANFAFNKVTNDLILLGNGIAENWGYGSKDRMYARTLSVAEMVEMLPKYLNFGTTTTILAFRPYPLGGGWIITYSEGQSSLIRKNIKVDGLLRDALFEMLKWLKQNKMI